ncbi:MAG: hypothetical protein AN485_11935 [Anabaena sp. MDT14b]|jgi:hypothetical protein|nr:MAG: hypothetical protein AN485_11935 [Anabaena sp. MDT14b]
MKPNFAQMSRSELKAYVRRNRDDLEALDILVSRRTPDSEATWYAPMVTAEGVPIEENVRLGEQAIQERIRTDTERKTEQDILLSSLIESVITGENHMMGRTQQMKFLLIEEKKKINQ